DMQRGAAIDGVNALGPHAEHLGEDELRRGEIGHRERDRPEAADLVVRRHGAVLPRMGLARAAVVDEVEALPLRILEGERRAPRPLADLADRAAGVGEMLAPPGEALLARDPEAGVDDGMRAAPLAADRPVEEGH